MKTTTSETDYNLGETVSLIGNVSDVCNYLSLVDYSGIDEMTRDEGVASIFSILGHITTKAHIELIDYLEANKIDY